MARTSKHKDAVKISDTKESAAKSSGSPEVTKPVVQQSHAELVAEHLPPMALVCCVLILSGSLFILGLRDALATGKPIAGPLDASLQIFTDSAQFFDDSRGWKSPQGGLSAIQSATTDENNMGGLFIRKVGGAAAATLHLQKIAPLLFHPDGAQWMAGHFRPLYTMAIFANMALAAFYVYYMEDLEAANAAGMAKYILVILGLESVILAFYLFGQKKGATRLPAMAMPEGKTEKSVTSRIVTRTVTVIGSIMSLVLLRDLFFPGFILDFIPRDDIYLEWTNAFVHSPPPGSQEMEEQGLESVLFVGDKFASHFMALNMLLCMAYKFLTAFGISYGSDGSGTVKCKMIWKIQCFGDLFILFFMRLFSAAAVSASLDLRWHLMLIGYESFILGLYAWF